MVFFAFMISGRFCRVDRMERFLAIPLRFDGVMYTDSFLTGWKYPTQFDAVLEKILRSIFKSCGKTYVFVVLPGGRFLKGPYSELAVDLADQLRPVDFVWIAMGNDLYDRPPSKYNDVEDRSLARSISKQMDKVSMYVQNQLLIFGGSSCIWKYSETISSVFANAYDDAVARVVDFLKVGGTTYAITGQGHLEGLALSDRIGHIDWSDASSGQIVERFLVYVVSTVSLPRRSKL